MLFTSQRDLMLSLSHERGEYGQEDVDYVASRCAMAVLSHRTFRVVGGRASRRVKTDVATLL